MRTTEREDAALAWLRVLADPTRLRIFLALRERERCVRDLVDTAGLPQPLVSYHLSALAQAGLVRLRRSRGFTLYALDPLVLTTARNDLLALLDPTDLDAVALPGGNPACCSTPHPGGIYASAEREPHPGGIYA